MLYSNLRRIAGEAPLSSGLRQGHEFHSYASLAERVERLAAGFAARDLRPGDPVIVLVPNSPELFVIVHALFAIGAIAVPLSPGATAAECDLAARKASARAFITLADRVGVIEEVAANLGDATRLPVFVSGGNGSNAIATLERTAPTRLPKIAGEMPALYLLSSGSTGLPKIVPHTHAELLSDAHRTSTAWGLTHEDVVFNMLPGNFAMGLLLGLVDAPQAGATTVYWSSARPLILARRSLVDTLVEENVTVMGAVPTMYEALVGTPGDDRLAAMRLAFSGGAALKRRTFEAFRDRFGVALRQSYGSTEAIMVAHNDADDADASWCSVGRPAGDAEVKIAPVEMAPAPDVGELLIRSSSVTAGYLHEPALNSVAFPDGWLRSGDLARLDTAGNIFIEGRLKLLIEVSGFKVDPLEVEDVLQLHPAVAEAVVVGARSSRDSERSLKAIVVRRDDVSTGQLTRYLREQLSAHKVPGLIEFRDALPKSSAGKIMRSQLGDDA